MQLKIIGLPTYPYPQQKPGRIPRRKWVANFAPQVQQHIAPFAISCRISNSSGVQKAFSAPSDM